MLQVTDAAVSVFRSEVLHEGDHATQGEPATAVRLRPAVTDQGAAAHQEQPVAKASGQG